MFSKGQWHFSKTNRIIVSRKAKSFKNQPHYLNAFSQIQINELSGNLRDDKAVSYDNGVCQ